MPIFIINSTLYFSVYQPGLIQLNVGQPNVLSSQTDRGNVQLKTDDGLGAKRITVGSFVVAECTMFKVLPSLKTILPLVIWSLRLRRSYNTSVSIAWDWITSATAS